MPLFEAIQDKTCVVFDFGTAYTKCGFAGETAPRCIVPSTFTRKNGEVVNIYDNNVSEADLAEGLVDFFYYIYFRELLVNTKHRRVMVVESVLSTVRVREVVARVLFNHFEVPSLFFGSSHLLSILTLGIKSALVVDSGYKDTIILPIYQSFPLLKALELSPLAGKSLHEYIKAQLLEVAIVTTEDGNQVPLSSIQKTLKEEFIEDIKIKTCFVTSQSRASDIQKASRDSSINRPTPPPSVSYPIDGRHIMTIPGKIREESCELFFENDEDDQSLPHLIIKSLLKCPIDSRRELMTNVVLMGGTSMLPGFKVRLINELKSLCLTPEFKDRFPNPLFKVHTPPCLPGNVPWLGGSIFSSIDVIVTMKSITLEQYKTLSTLPDWSSLASREQILSSLSTSPPPSAPVSTSFSSSSSSDSKNSVRLQLRGKSSKNSNNTINTNTNTTTTTTTTNAIKDVTTAIDAVAISDDKKH